MKTFRRSPSSRLHRLAAWTLVAALAAPPSLLAQVGAAAPPSEPGPSSPGTEPDTSGEPTSAPGQPGSQPGAKPGKPDLFAQSVKAAQEAVEEYGAYDNPKELERVNRIAFQLLAKADFDRYPFSFGMVDMPVPNAFALPGGQIFVTRGMLDLEPDDDMLANVLGHEITHVTHEHYLKMKKKATLMSVLGNALMLGVIVGAGRSNRDYPNPGHDPLDTRDNSADILQGAAAASVVVSELLLRSYSRENEDDADDEGQRLAAAAGYDPAGAQKFWALLNARAPQAKEYGYLQTHPFAEDRAKYATVRAAELKIQQRGAADALRQKTQGQLMTWIEKNRPKGPELGFVKAAALATWPMGPVAESLRLEKLHVLRDDTLAKPLLARDFGTVLKSYRAQREQVVGLTPESPLLAKLDGEIADLEAKSRDAYPKAVETLEGGIYETSFLEAFLANYPDSPRVPEVALSLGNAYARLGNQTQAVAQYLRAFEAGPESPAGIKAHAGLRNLAPNLEMLAALQDLVDREKEPELRQKAEERLAAQAKIYDDLANGAEYLHRYPEGIHVPVVIERLNKLADDLYGEVVLYQGVGEMVKALDRIQRILTHAPLSPAAAKLRDHAVIANERAG
ncbi:MAG TPA: M48 family metalloprotease [Thermoanaerobaculia bacterium]|jgi:predicted Zn-dependent protease|nr:M48 family metalloprotease [Thermoanaerobaculia bacterium]